MRRSGTRRSTTSWHVASYTTVINTGTQGGACVPHIMNHVNGILLHCSLAGATTCSSLVVVSAFTVCFGQSSGPEDPAVQQFVKWWPLANQGRRHMNTGSTTPSRRRQIILPLPRIAEGRSSRAKATNRDSGALTIRVLR
ncbi:hypothetical protein GWK47_043331 [Chionoecetes opilio]|uniref:Uncharacterized protein n=1 Tax=Chionoecetes opilio TaxID=41210 RepID=A0A8J4YM23_CHIOP|nr:hypothetical protein GWK47_043331 [Chionoecetes opilio]